MKTNVDPGTVAARLRQCGKSEDVTRNLRRYMLSRNPCRPAAIYLRNSVSTCCEHPVYVAGDRSTRWYACGKCGEATDPVSLEPMNLA